MCWISSIADCIASDISFAQFTLGVATSATQELGLARLATENATGPRGIWQGKEKEAYFSELYGYGNNELAIFDSPTCTLLKFNRRAGLLGRVRGRREPSARATWRAVSNHPQSGEQQHHGTEIKRRTAWQRPVPHRPRRGCVWGSDQTILLLAAAHCLQSRLWEVGLSFAAEEGAALADAQSSRPRVSLPKRPQGS